MEQATSLQTGSMMENLPSQPIKLASGRLADDVASLGLMDKSEELLKTLSLLSTILESTADGLLVVDLTGKVVTYNRKFADMWKIPTALLATKDDATLLNYVLEQLTDPDCFLQRVRELMSQPEAESKDELRFKDGSIVERYSQPHRIGDQIVGRVWSFRDVTQRKRAEMELKRWNRELEQRVQERTAELEAFCYSVSHDLRGPIRSIASFSQMLKEDCEAELNQDGREMLQIVIDSARRMDQLLFGLLALSRLVRTEMQQCTVNLSAIVEAIAADFRSSDPQRAVEFVIAPNLVAWGDERMLRMALENLLNNAWKFTQRCPQSRIEFGMELTEGHRAYFVRDNGVGFDMAYVGKVFGVFERLHSETDFPGTGIGLAIVQRVIARHGGTIWAKAVVNEGATFYFTLE